MVLITLNRAESPKAYSPGQCPGEGVQRMRRPERAKASMANRMKDAFALTGRYPSPYAIPGCYPGLNAFAPTGRNPQTDCVPRDSVYLLLQMGNHIC